MKKSIILTFSLCVILCYSCSRDEFLDIKPDKSLVVPNTLEDLKAMLNNTLTMNRGYGSIPNIASDDYFISYNTWNSLHSMSEKSTYIWADDIYEEDDLFNDWKLTYQTIYYSNLIIKYSKKLLSNSEDQMEIKEVIAQARFFRAWAYHCLSVIYCKTYEAETANTDLGLPIRTDYDVTLKVERSSLEDLYSFIISELKEIIDELPSEVSLKTLPTKVSASALLSRVFLMMNKFEESLYYTDKVLGRNNQLIDHKVIDITKVYSFDLFNEEILFYSAHIASTALSQTYSRIDSNLYDLYEENDLRKFTYFRADIDDSKVFKGSYSGSNILFNGLSTSEVILNRAECLARLNKKEEAKGQMDYFLAYRYKGILPEYSLEEVLNFILLERRRELVLRGIRWIDLKRLNLNKDTETVLKRNLDDIEYTLLPNSKNYVFTIPYIVIELSGIKQNEK